MIEKYEDIVYLPHPKSSKYPQMSMINRAAQFSPFAALTGHNAAIKETARITDKRIELDESTKELIRDRLQIISTRIKECRWNDKGSISNDMNVSKDRIRQDTLKLDSLEYSITYFQPDGRKIGGSYLTTTGRVMKIDEYKRWIIMMSGEIIPMDEITMIDGKIFEYIDN